MDSTTIAAINKLPNTTYVASTFTYHLLARLRPILDEILRPLSHVLPRRISSCLRYLSRGWWIDGGGEEHYSRGLEDTWSPHEPFIASLQLRQARRKPHDLWVRTSSMVSDIHFVAFRGPWRVPSPGCSTCGFDEACPGIPRIHVVKIWISVVMGWEGARTEAQRLTTPSSTVGGLANRQNQSSPRL